MKLQVFVEMSRETGLFRVYCPELPGCSAAEDSREEALEELRRRIRDHFRSARRVPPGAECVEIDL